MTWGELDQLPEEIAGEIESWNGPVVWMRRGPAEHQTYSKTIWNALRRCLADRYQDIRGDDVLIVGEVLSPSNRGLVEAKKVRYASAQIPWYWEVDLSRGPNPAHGIETVRAYGLMTEGGPLPDGARPMYPNNYVLIDEWSPKDTEAIRTEFPFPIDIPWTELEPE
ncbi:Uma2 family endonuclease [Nocardia sp. NPDC051030]|uniref:Uma2 family endonuclease n=1 Tax=Nocardia sp. NPDC051030 TaxID=3155162 RepID=UPI003425C953